MFNTFKVIVKCIANGYTHIIGMRLTFKDGTTATFRDGFKIEMEV